LSPRAATTARRTSVPRGARQRALIVVERLKELYPAQTALFHSSPWELLVATILSAQTTDEQVNKVTPELFKRYPTPEALASADIAEVEQIIRPTGFFHSKARAIVEMSRDLVTLRGVGRKTANVVLGAAFGLPGFAVDTHVTRLTRRLGLTRSSDPVQIERDVTSMVPPEEWSGLSLRLILHGRRVCTARNPRHDICVLRDICPSAEGEPKKPRAARAKPRAQRSPKEPTAAQ
jgi:endonuclease-3